MSEEEPYYGEFDVSKRKKLKPPEETITFPEKKKGILGKLASRRKEAKARRADAKRHRKEVDRRYREAYREAEFKAVPAQAKRDVQKAMLKRQRGRAETFKKLGKGLAKLDRELAKGSQKKKRKKGSKIIIVDQKTGKVRTVRTSDSEPEEIEETDPFSILFGVEEEKKKKRRQPKDTDPLKMLFG